MATQTAKRLPSWLTDILWLLFLPSLLAGVASVGFFLQFIFSLGGGFLVKCIAWLPFPIICLLVSFIFFILCFTVCLIIAHVFEIFDKKMHSNYPPSFYLQHPSFIEDTPSYGPIEDTPSYYENSSYGNFEDYSSEEYGDVRVGERMVFGAETGHGGPFISYEPIYERRRVEYKGNWWD